MAVSPGDSYEAWPLVIVDGDELLAVYSDGSQHLYTSGRTVKARRRALAGGTWSAEETVYNSANDDAAFSIGLDSTGRPLVWVLERTGADFDTGTGNQVLRRCDSGTWSTVTTITPGTPKIRLINPIVELANGDLMAHWQGVSDGSSEWGVLISGDDGVTWTQTTIASGLADAARPIEVRFVVLSDGSVLGIGRTEEDGGELFQLTLGASGDPTDPSDWTVASTNIADQDRTPSALIVEDDDTLHLYYYDRDNGVLRYRTVAAGTVFSSPTSWPSSSARVSYGGVDADGGYPHGLRIDGSNVVAYYSGTSALCQVFLHEHAV